MQNGWIKMSERKPTEADLPVIFGGFYGEETAGWTQIYCANLLMSHSSWTHWTPQLKVPPPPSKEPSQDEADFIARYGRPHTTEGFQRMNGWLNGVKDERSFIRSALDHFDSGFIGVEGFVKRLKERVGSE